MSIHKYTADMRQQCRTSFKGDVLRLVTGTGIAQVITVLASPILTRLYGPEAFGVAAMFMSLTGIIGVLACMRYEMSIVLPVSDREAANLLGVSLCFALGIGLLTIPIIWFGGPQILELLKMSKLAPFLWVIPITVWLNGTFNALYYWNIRTKHFTNLSAARVISHFCATSGVLGVGFAGYATGGAIIASTIGGQVVETSFLVGQTWRNKGKLLLQSIKWQGLSSGLVRYKDFPIYSSWGALMNSASWQLPALMLGFFFSPVIVGYYALGFRIIQMPVNLIGSAISQVFLQRASIAKRSEDVGPLVEHLFQKLLIAALLPSLILAVLGKDLFVFVFGVNWAEAGIYSQILAIWALVWFISGPLGMIYIVLKQQKKEPVVHGLILITRVLALGLGGYLGEARLAILFFTIGGILSYGYLIMVVFHFCHIGMIDVIWRSRFIFGKAIVYVLPIVFLRFMGLNGFYALVGAGVALIIYFRNHIKTFTLSANIITKKI